MIKEAFVNKRTLEEQSEDEFAERVRKNAIELSEFFENKGLGVPVGEILEEGFLVVPKTDLVHSAYWNAQDNAAAKIELSRVGQTRGIFGKHTQMHEMTHALSRHQDLNKVTEVLFPNGMRGSGATQLGGKTGFHYYLERPGDQHSLQLFSALNEALTDTVPIEILKTQDWGKIYQRFLFIYPRERNMLATIISSMARRSGENEESVFRLFVESNLIGWTSALKEQLLETFGPNALRVLAIINSPVYVKDQKDSVTLGKWWKFWEKNYYNEALTYFDVERLEQERDDAARKILPKEGPLHFVERKDSV